MFNYNDIIEYEDCTRDLKFEAAQKWAREHNTSFEELIDRRELKVFTEEFEEEYEEEHTQIIPAVTHEEKDEKGNTITVVDEPEQEEKTYETKTRPATREIKKLFRYFQIGAEPVAPEPTPEEMKAQEIAELRAYLESTDYISNKLIEAIDDAELQDLKEKYADVLARRREARVRINELEK